MKKMLSVGLIGLFITVATNLAGVLVLDQPASAFFSKDWWSVWFPLYLVWIILTIIGFGGYRRKPKT